MNGNFLQIAQERAWTRRDFLRTAIGAGVWSTISRRPLLAGTTYSKKTVVVTFGAAHATKKHSLPRGKRTFRICWESWFLKRHSARRL